MITVKVFDKEEFKTTSWSGGVTTELFIWPEGASYAERRFDFRISTAVVELEESRFTNLPGVKRYLTPLCRGGFSLAINGAEPIELPEGRVLYFSGEDDITCYGSGRDLNLMLKNAKGEMKCITAGSSVLLPEASFSFVYAVEDTSLTFNGETLAQMQKGEFARLSGAGTFTTDGRLVMFIVCLQLPY